MNSSFLDCLQLFHIFSEFINKLSVFILYLKILGTMLHTEFQNLLSVSHLSTHAKHIIFILTKYSLKLWRNYSSDFPNANNTIGISELLWKLCYMVHGLVCAWKMITLNEIMITKSNDFYIGLNTRDRDWLILITLITITLSDAYCIITYLKNFW